MRLKYLWVSVAACAAWSTPLGYCQASNAAASAHTSSTYTAPLTTFGTPDFEGVWTQNFILMIEASPKVPMLTLPEPAAKAMTDAVAKGISEEFDRLLDPETSAGIKQTDGLPIVRGQRRTREIVEPADGRLPYTPQARKDSEAGRTMPPSDNVEERPYWERCITSLGLPPVTGVITAGANPRRIVQTPGYVVIHTEYGDEARIIPLALKHQPSALRPLLGDSIAHWEGQSLVIETVGLPEQDRVRPLSNLVVSSESKVTERFTRLSDVELLYQFTIEDPKTYSAPWLAEYSLYRTDQRMFEHACHEGNHSLPNILRAKRIEDARAPSQR